MIGWMQPFSILYHFTCSLSFSLNWSGVMMMIFSKAFFRHNDDGMGQKNLFNANCLSVHEADRVKKSETRITNQIFFISTANWKFLQSDAASRTVPLCWGFLLLNIRHSFSLGGILLTLSLQHCVWTRWQKKKSARNENKREKGIHLNIRLGNYFCHSYLWILKKMLPFCESARRSTSLQKIY